MSFAWYTIKRGAGYESIDCIAGGETAGIPFAAWIAERLGLPMLYVRKKPKGFGRDAQIEGAFREGSRVLLVEDLATDGGSKLNFVDAIRRAGAEIAHTFVIFRSEEHTSELQSLMRRSSAVLCLKKKTDRKTCTQLPTP